MTAITSYAPRFPALQPGDHYQQSATAMHASSLTDSTLRIRTAEGDIVTISRHAEMNAQSLTYDSHGNLNGATTSVHGESAQFAASSSTSVTVKGDLNAEEQADIQKLVDALNQAEQGDGGGAFGDLIASGELDTIRSFAGKVRHSETRSVQHAALSVAVAEQPSGQSIPTTPASSSPPDDAAPHVPRFRSLHHRLLDQLHHGHRHADGEDRVWQNGAGETDAAAS